MVEVINEVKNLKQLYIGKGLQSTSIVNKASGLQPVVNKRNVKKENKLLKVLKF